MSPEGAQELLVISRDWQPNQQSDLQVVSVSPWPGSVLFGSTPLRSKTPIQRGDKEMIKRSVDIFSRSAASVKRRGVFETAANKEGKAKCAATRWFPHESFPLCFPPSEFLLKQADRQGVESVHELGDPVEKMDKKSFLTRISRWVALQLLLHDLKLGRTASRGHHRCANWDV